MPEPTTQTVVSSETWVVVRHFASALVLPSLAVLPDQSSQVSSLAKLHDDVEHSVLFVDESFNVAYDVVVLVEMLENVANNPQSRPSLAQAR